MKKFEYKSVPIPTKGKFFVEFDMQQFDEQLNELGKLGWELVNCLQTNNNIKGYANIYAYLKREKI